MKEPTEKADPLTSLLPSYEVVQRRECLVNRPAADVFNALFRFNPQDDRLLRTLFWAHDAPARLFRRAEPNALALSTLGPLGYDAMYHRAPVSGERGELILGFAGRFWLPYEPIRRLDADAFVAWEQGGTTKVVWHFEVTQLTGQKTRLACLLRAHSYGAAATRHFGVYWRLVQRPSGVIRRAILADVAQIASQANKHH